MDKPIALANLQSEKDLLECEASALRQSLHELRQAGREHALPAHVWQSEFARQHEQLVLVASKIGGLDKRILALVEGNNAIRRPESDDCSSTSQTGSGFMTLFFIDHRRIRIGRSAVELNQRTVLIPGIVFIRCRIGTGLRLSLRVYPDPLGFCLFKSGRLFLQV
jgi:hypothetical protein